MSEIIIDGVDVSGCEYLNKEDCTCDNENNHNIGCGQYDTCNYKQLKRLQAENERLSNMKCPNCGEEYLSPTGADFFEENERLKKEIKKEKEIYKENVHYLACMTSQRNKLKIALEEIREIAEENSTCAGYDCWSMLRVLDKISEVLDERD